MPILSLFILILMFVTPIVTILTVMLQAAEKKQVANWPSTAGQVADVRLLKSGNQYLPEAVVTFTVANETYTIRQRPISQTGQSKGSKAWARQVSLQFKPGTAVPVYYHPDRPKRATLNPQQAGARGGRSQTVSVIMIVLAIGIHLLGSRGLAAAYLDLTGSSLMITLLMTLGFTLLLGAALGLLVQELRQPKT